MIWLRQSTASQEVPLGFFVDSTDGDTAETALTIANTDIQLWKSGATTLANKNSGGATHISGGIYYATLDATDTNTLGPLVLFVHVSGALTVRLECLVLPANVYDSLVAGSDNLEVDAVQWLGTACATPTNAGVPEVDVTHVGGSAEDLPTATVIGSPAGADLATDIASVKTDTGNIETDTQDIQSRLPAALVSGKIDADATAISGSAAAADNLESQMVGTVTGTAQAGAAGSITLASGESATDDLFAGETVVILSGTGAGQSRVITGYTGSSKVAAVSPNWTTNPDATSVYALVPSAPAPTAAGSLPQVDVREWVGDTVPSATQTGRPLVDVTHVSGVAEDIASAAGLATAQADLDTLTGTDGAQLATSQPNYAPATAAALSTHDGKLDTVDANVDTLLARITSTLFSGITSLAEWLGMLAGKQTGDATALTEIRATGAGSGTFDPTTDSEEAISDSGGGGPTAAQIADAVWEEAIADHSGTAGSTAEALNAAGSAGDPWVTALPGAYGAGSAGNIVGNLNDLSSADVTAAVPTAAAIRAEIDSNSTELATIVAATAASAIRTALGMAAADLDTQLDALPTAAENRAEMDSNSTQLAAIVAATAAGAIRTAVGLAAANLDTQLGAIPTADIATLIGTPSGADLVADIAANLAAVAALNDFDPATDTVTIATDGLDTVTAVDGLTVREAIAVILASVAGQLSGAATTTITISNAAGTQTRITATVDGSGNRSAVTLDTTGV